MPAGSLTHGVDSMATMLSNLAAFQTLTGTITPAAALAFIYKYDAQEVAAWPIMVVRDRATNTTKAFDEAGADNFHLDGGVLDLIYIERVAKTEADPYPDGDDLRSNAIDLSTVIAGLHSAASTEGFELVQVNSTTPPILMEERDDETTPGTVYRWIKRELEVAWRGW